MARLYPLPAWAIEAAGRSGIDLVALTDDPQPAAPAATTQQESNMPTAKAPTITRADRPYNDLTTTEIVAKVEALDPLAVLEAQLRLTHARTLRPHNRRRLAAAVAFAATSPEPESVPVPEPEPEKVVDPTVLARRIAGERAAALAAEGNRVKAKIKPPEPSPSTGSRPTT
jgi:hypothetical protein